MPTRLVVTMTAAEGRGDAFGKAFVANVRDVRKEPGCEQYELFRSLERADTFVLIERWKDRASLEAHMAGMRSRPSPVAAIRATPPVMEQYEVP